MEKKLSPAEWVYKLTREGLGVSGALWGSIVHERREHEKELKEAREEPFWFEELF